ncbi:MAG: stage III sporulation protein AA [Clostridiales bacterium]|nr:stage III sporulation protein AA [Candidatus Apopatousia equi]
MMLENVLPFNVQTSLSFLDYKGLYELRIRANKVCTVNYYNNYYFLGINGITDKKENAIILSQDDIAGIIQKASNYSLYAVNDELKNGFLCLPGGIRIGLVGQTVSENNSIITIKNISSLNIRFPHEVKGIAEKVIDFLLNGIDFLNTLIISPAGVGKTTLLRDLIRLLSSVRYAKNVLVVDERNEISSSTNSVCGLDLGDFSDVIVSCPKEQAIVSGIRSMSPDIIATDELGTKKDVEAVEFASTCGTNILATIHAKNLEELKWKKDFEPLINNKIFKRYIFLSNRKGKGTIERIYNENFETIL